MSCPNHPSTGTKSSVVLGLLPFPSVEDMVKLSQQNTAMPGNKKSPPSIPLKNHGAQVLLNELMTPVITLCRCLCGLEFGLHSRNKGFRGFFSNGLPTTRRHEAAHSS